jgi:transcription elongation GreA/GreB family factor
MSRAFVRETDLDASETLPERPISTQPNFVTPSGLEQIEVHVQQLALERNAVLASENRDALAWIERELRYWRQRRASARVTQPAAAPEVVRFGVRVQVRFKDDSERAFRIVGEDEADPNAGLVSWSSPVAAALIGHRLDDVVEIFGRRAEIVALSA